KRSRPACCGRAGGCKSLSPLACKTLYEALSPLQARTARRSPRDCWQGSPGRPVPLVTGRILRPPGRLLLLLRDFLVTCLVHGLLRGFVRALGGDLLLARALLLCHGRSLTAQLIGLRLRQFPGIDERGYADMRELLDIARHASAQSLCAKSIFAAISMVVVG